MRICDTEKIVIRPGISTFVISLILICLGTFITSFVTKYFNALFFTPAVPGTVFLDKVFAFLFGLIWALFAITPFYMSVSILSQKYIVCPKGIEVRRLARNVNLNWTDVHTLAEFPMLFLPNSNYVLFIKGTRGVSLSLSFMKDPQRSAKALIEAIYLSRQKVNIKLSHSNKFNSPPYGIFHTPEN